MDSGGPVLWENPTTHNIILVGITSSGIGCASNEPAIDTRTGAFIDWIVSVTPGKSWQIGKLENENIITIKNELNIMFLF